jgi:hypothetical protein
MHIEKKFYEQLVSARQAAEWGMQCLQGAFGRLKVPMPADDPQFRQLLLLPCVRLHNVRARIVGINQIRTVYEGIWTAAAPGLYSTGTLRICSLVIFGGMIAFEDFKIL